MLRFDSLDSRFQNDEVRKYYAILKKKRISLFIKRIFDIIFSLILLVLLSPIIVFVAICIKLDSPGGVFYRQKRITTYGKEFHIFKFRTMVQNADQLGSSVTLQDDPRISRVGKKIRKLRIDEIPQLLNVLIGDMSFVGTRPEVEKYVSCYSNEMFATLLMPAGITSTSSIKYKDEDEVISKYVALGEHVDEIYIKHILPEKMKYNLEYIEKFSFINDIKIMINTAIQVFK